MSDNSKNIAGAKSVSNDIKEILNIK